MTGEVICCAVCNDLHQEMIDDRTSHDDYTEGTYLGVTYVIKKSSLCWCGYIDENCIPTITPHGDWTGSINHQVEGTGQYINMKGFDTCHGGDYYCHDWNIFIPNCSNSGEVEGHPTYKSFEWVENHIKNLINSSFP